MEPIAELEDKEEIDCDFDSCPALSSCFSQTTSATATPKTSDLETEKKLDTKAIYHNNNSDKNIIKMNNNTDCDTNEQPLNSSSMCNSQNQSNQQQQQQQQNKQNNMNQNSQFRSRSYTWPHLSSQNDESNCESSGIYGVDDDDDMIPMISNIGQLNSHYDPAHHLNAYTDPDDLMLPMLIGMTMPNSNASTINGNVPAPNDSCWSNNHSVAQAAYSFGETLLPMANQMQQQQHLYPLARNSVSNNNGNSSQSNDNHVSTSIQYANSNGNNRVTSTANNNRNNDTNVSALMSSDQQAYFDGTIANSKNINNNKNNHDANHNAEQYSSLTADVNPTTISTTAITTTMPSVGQQQQQQRQQQQQPNGGQYIQRQRSGSNQHAHQQQQQPKQNPEQSSQPSQTSSASGTATANNKKNTSRRNAWGNMSYADLITQAINGSVDKRLTLSQIYEWMVQNVHYFKDKGDSNSSAGWKNSIRHNLSLHNRFMRVQNEGTGKSSWWMINPDAKPGKAARRRAISMETQNYEKRRGRVKKRVEQLRAAQAANALTGPAAGIGENVSLSTLSEYGPPLMKSSSSEINLATGLMSPSSFKHQPQHFLSSSGGVLHHSKNLSRASNASLSNLNLSDPISTGLNNNNSHILVTSPSSTESFDLYSESSLLIGPCSSSSHYIHHPNSYSPNEFRPRASSNASSTCSNLLIDSSDNNQVSTLWYGSNGSNLNNPNASYNTSTDAYTPSNMDSSLQMIECLHLDADSSPHQTYQTMFMDDPQTSAASEAEPPPSSSSSSQISINLQSSKPSISTTSNQNNQQNIGTDGNAVNNGHNGLSGSNSKSSSSGSSGSSSSNNNNNNNNNNNSVRPNSYHDLFNRLQPNTSTSIASPSTTTTANKQQQVSNKKCQNNNLKLGINIDNVNSNLDDGDADANNLNQSTPNYYKSAATISPTNNKDVNDCLSDPNKDAIDCNNDTNIDGAKCNVQLNNGTVHDNINNSQNQNCNNNGHPKVANNGTSGDSSGQYSGADEPLSYHAMQQSLSLPLSLSSSSSSSPPSSSLLMHQTKMQPYNDLYGVATSVNRISDNNANHHSASASEDGGGYGMTPPSSYYHQMSYQHHAHHPNNDSTIAYEMSGGDSNAHNSNSNIDIDFMMPIVADDTIRNNNHNHNNSQALLNLSDPMIFDLSESQQQHNRQQLALEESEDTSTNQCPPLVAQQPQDSMDELINSYTNSSHQQSAYSSASASGNGAGGVGVGGGNLQQLPNHGHMQSHQPHSYVSYVEGRFEKNPHHYVLSALEHQQLQQHSQQPPFPSISGHHQYHPISMENNQRISTGSGDGNNNAQQSGPTSAAATGTTTTSHPVASRSWVH